MRFIVAVARRNLLAIGVIMAAALALTVIATLLQTPQYTAASKIQINDNSGRILSQEDTPDDGSAGGGYDTERFLKTQTEVIGSRGLALRVAQKLNLASNPSFFAISQATAPKAGTPMAAVESRIAAILKHNLDVRLPQDSRIVSISYTSTDPDMAAKIANTYASEFIQSNLQRKFDSSSYAREFLGDQLQTAKKKVEDSERALNSYAREAGLIIARSAAKSPTGNSDEGSSVTTASLSQLNQAANDATARRIVAEGRWRTISSGSLMNASEVITNGTIATLMGQKAQLEGALKEEQSRHLDSYPTVAAKRSQLKSINDQIQTVAASIKNSVKQDYASALDTERQLLEQVRGLKTDTLAEQDRTVQYGLLSREADTNRQVYDGLLERYKKLNATAGISLSNISIIDTAERPGGASSPNLIKNLLVGILAGGAIAAFIVFFREQFNDSIRVPEDVEAKLGMSLLGVVPGSAEEDLEGALTDPKSPVTEAYNSLRSVLMYSTPEGLPRILQITSAQPAEGKTTSSIALASGLARMGRRVLLIDADLRRPSIHRRVDCSNETGLTTLLTSKIDLNEVVVQSAQENLSIMPSGPVPPSPTELLSSPRLEEILQIAASRFDSVILDSPPVLGLADAPLMAALADGVVFVVEANRNRRGALRTALRRLRSMNPILLGTVLTKFRADKVSNQYSDYYGYDYYQYGDSSSKAS